MNVLWILMTTASLAVLLVTHPADALPSMLGAANTAISACFGLLGVYLVWLGLFEIVDKSGVNAVLARGLRPVIRLLYGDIPPLAAERLTLNMSANLLGLGGAATPMGIAAMQALDDGTGRATDAQIMLVVLNATSLQLLPTTLIGIRAAAGAVSPADIVLPGFITTAVTTAAGIVLCKFCARISKKRATRRV